MNLSEAIKLAVTISLAAAAIGKLPQLVGMMQVVELELLRANNSSSWGKVQLLKQGAARSDEKANSSVEELSLKTLRARKTCPYRFSWESCGR